MFASKIASILFATALSCAAQPVSVPVSDKNVNQASKPTCELHIWPAPPFTTLTESFVWNHSADSAYKGTESNRTVPRQNPLSSENQLRLLGNPDLIRLLYFGPVTIVTHDAPLTRRAIGSAKTRIIESDSPCYYELIVSKIIYSDMPLAGRTLRVLFTVNQFSAASLAEKSYAGWGQAALRLFPAKPGEDVVAADRDLADAFEINFQGFAISSHQFLSRTAK